MAANANGDYKVFKYYEGLCSSANFPKEIAKVLALGVKSEAVKDIDGNVIEEPFVHQSKNWDIVYPTPDTNITYITKDGVSQTITFLPDEYGVPIVGKLGPDDYTQKILNQVNKISDTVILKTTTDAKIIEDEEVDDLTVDATSNSKDLTMYLEIYKPTYVANPEEYPLDCEREGIIPQLITKDIYEESMQTSRSVEEAIYMDSYTDESNEEDKCCKESTEINRTNGSITIDATTSISYLNKICKIYNDDGKIQPPSGANGSVSTTIDATYLAKIKQEDAELYSFILNNLNDGEGIEPKEYSQLTDLLFELFKITDNDGNETYTVQLLGSTTLKIYEIKAGKTYATAHMPNVSLTPEYYLDGIYIPLETNLYHAADNVITFDENIKFTASVEGVLVIRYTYDASASSIISDRKTMLNNHYVLMRLFDNISNDHSGPAENVYNSSGDITQTNSHISPWSKLSWYQDFEEVMIDTIDTDVSVNSIQDGTVFVPLETVGLNADTKMRYWINTNNNRFSIIVMGNPSLDYERDRHIISACYCGRIDSFDNSINDTAGNFALFTCSSTEPCNTVLAVNKNEKPMENYILDDINNYDSEVLANIIKNSKVSAAYTQDRQYYDIQLPDKMYFDRTQTPKYIIVKNGVPLTTLKSYDKEWRTTNGKTDLCTIELHPDDINNDNIQEPCTVYFYFGYYEETYAITSGVARDVFGNVIDVSKVDDYGINTSDGVTSIMMYHTRSKAYYQKHHMMFATTEEYMSKVMYGKSSYTGEYYADRIKVTHGNDGPRGTLSDLLVIDSSSLYALDELVINKDFEKDPDEYEETFVYFPITAPYSPLSDSPNARYGLAIKKAEVEPSYEDETKLLSIAVNQLQDIANDAWFPVYSDITPLQQTKNGCMVYWRIVENSGIVYDKEDNATYSEYIPVKLVVTNNSQYMGNEANLISPTTGVTVAKGSKVADATNAYIAVSGFEPTNGESIYYGIADATITSFGGPVIDADGNTIPGSAAQLKAILFDGALDDTEEDDAGGWQYGINGVPYTEMIGSQLPTGDLRIEDASPEKYLVLYSAKEEVIEGETRVTISKFACVPLKNDVNDNDLLQYPCSINVLCNGGDGTMTDNLGNSGVYINATINYNATYEVTFTPEEGYTTIKSVTVNDKAATLENNSNKLVISSVTEDTQIKVTFE